MCNGFTRNIKWTWISVVVPVIFSCMFTIECRGNHLITPEVGDWKLKQNVRTSLLKIISTSEEYVCSTKSTRVRVDQQLSIKKCKKISFVFLYVYYNILSPTRSMSRIVASTSSSSTVSQLLNTIRKKLMSPLRTVSSV